MKEKFRDLYMKIAVQVSAMSYASRKKVGCVIVSPQDLICIGYNGMPSGWENECEVVIGTHRDADRYIDVPILKTKDEVLHAESNALMKAAREGFRLKGSALFCTCSPCIECAKLIHQAGISEVYYQEEYRSKQGLEFLQRCDIKVEQVVERIQCQLTM